MKKSLFVFICLLFFSAASQAQCIPDTSITHNVPGAYPDTVQNLPHAVVAIPYSADIQVTQLSNGVCQLDEPKVSGLCVCERKTKKIARWRTQGCFCPLVADFISKSFVRMPKTPRDHGDGQAGVLWAMPARNRVVLAESSGPIVFLVNLQP